MRPRRRIAVFGSFLANPQSPEYQLAEDLGYLLAVHGIKVICGGHGGIVTALASGATRGGGEILGISLAESKQLQRNAKMNPLLTETEFAGTISERLALFANADGYVFFTGGIGSLAEFAFIWHSLQVAGDFSRPVLFVSRAWKRVLAEIKQEQMIKYKYYRHLYLCDTVKEAMAILTDDYSQNPEEIFYKECVLFDLDGTIVESPEEEFRRSCEGIGYFFHPADVAESFRKAGGLRRAPEGKTLTPDDCIGYHLDVLENLGIERGPATGIAAHVCSKIRQVPELYADVADALAHLRDNGFSTGLISSRHPMRLQEILSAHGLTGSFNFTIGSRRPSGARPGPRLFEEASALSGFPREGIIHIGTDYQEDYLYPRTVGVDSILLDRHLDHIADDDAVKIRSLRELRHLLRHRAIG
ncbi:MAG: HAD hydrolase-like protein [Geobacteraceae bacterium]|nr:HAD hydrolase-like protein [Geobacteraceae bacterium]